MKNIHIPHVAFASVCVIALCFIFMMYRSLDFRSRMQDREESYISQSKVTKQKSVCDKTGGILFGRRVMTGKNIGEWHATFCEYNMDSYNRYGVNYGAVSVNGYWDQKSDYVVVK